MRQRILEAGKAYGLEANFHGDELNYTGSAEMAGAIGACACSHLEHVSAAGIQAMARAGTVAVLLPTTAYVLRIAMPPARALIDAGVAVALGSDFNPNAHCVSLPFVMNLACVQMRMTLNEALVAATLNAAASLKRSVTHGSLEVGKFADFVVVGHPVIFVQFVLHRISTFSVMFVLIIDLRFGSILFTNSLTRRSARSSKTV
jgi:imidazolonepropionase